MQADQTLAQTLEQPALPELPERTARPGAWTARADAIPEPPLEPPVYCYRCPVCGAAPFAAVYLTHGGEIRGCDQCLLALPPEEGGIAWPDPWTWEVREYEDQ